MDIFLVRHGEAAASWGQAPDPGLSELGREQAESVARQLLAKVDRSTALVSSPLARAQETAQPLARKLGVQVAITDVFREIPSPVPMEQRQDWLRGFMRQRWDEQEPSLHDWKNAAVDTLLALQSPTVVFTHFLVINAVVGHVQQRAETLCFWPDNGSITHLRLGEGGLELVALGQELKTLVN